MNDEELAALTVALELLTARPATSAADDTPAISRWKMAARRPDLNMEELRVLY
ncbi:MAG TPA: acyl-CoA carboxylase epsilon subunit [Candidatus Aquilonibacter sp.]|nr:acyl-CoA carboxylase epsilon subunit [Candidatus Aquilonibacter sp.]